MVSLDFLEKVSVFEDLDDEQLKDVQACCTECEFMRDERIFTANEEPEYLWVVLEGRIDLLRDSESSLSDNFSITSLDETMIFGWSSLVPPYKYILTARCSSRACKVVKIERACITRLLKENIRTGYMVMSKLVSVVGQRFHQLQDEVARRRGQDIINQW